MGAPTFDFRLALGTRVRVSPFFDASVAAGVTHFTVYNHMLMPVTYGDPLGEYQRLRESVAVWDVSVQRQIEVRGPQASELAQLLSTRDLTGIAVGQGKYTPMCDHQGRLLNDPLLLRAETDAYWFSIADNDVLLWARAVGSERRLDVEVRELDVAPLAVQGPRAEEVMAALLGEEVYDIKFFRYRPFDLDGIPLLAGRAGWSKQGGFELYLLDPERGTDLWHRVMEAGAPYDIGPGAPNSIERMESGLFSLRTDAPEDADPFEVGLGRWVDLDRGVDFIGKDALAAKAAAGLTRELVGVFIDGGTLPPIIRPWPARCDGRVMGTIRSAAFSPWLGANIGYAFVHVPANRPGTKLEIDAGDGARTATVTTLPFTRDEPQ